MRNVDGNRARTRRETRSLDAARTGAARTEETLALVELARSTARIAATIRHDESQALLEVARTAMNTARTCETKGLAARALLATARTILAAARTDEIHALADVPTDVDGEDIYGSSDEQSDEETVEVVLAPVTAAVDNNRENADCNSGGEVEFLRVEGTEIFAHSREDCPIHPFVPPPRYCGHNSQFCPSCYCYICQVPVPQCSDWTFHANAKRGVSFWEHHRELSAARRLFSQTVDLPANTVRYD
jgi:hypothetical protein